MGAAEHMAAVTAEAMAEAAMAAALAEGTVEVDLEEETVAAAKEEGSAVAKVAAMVVEATEAVARAAERVEEAREVVVRVEELEVAMVGERVEEATEVVVRAVVRAAGAMAVVAREAGKEGVGAGGRPWTWAMQACGMPMPLRSTTLATMARTMTAGLTCCWRRFC